MAVKLGTIVTDSITGFTGVAISRTEYLHGCARVCVQPKELKDGKPIESGFFDELQLIENVPAVGDKKKGGTGDVPSARSVPPGRAIPSR